MIPCSADPELDDEARPSADGGAGLSPVRTGCLDIDMDVTSSAADIHDDNCGGVVGRGGGGVVGDDDDDDADGLSGAGRGCVEAMADVISEGGGSVRDLRIDLGIAGRRLRRRRGGGGGGGEGAPPARADVREGDKEEEEEEEEGSIASKETRDFEQASFDAAVAGGGGTSPAASSYSAATTATNADADADADSADAAPNADAASSSADWKHKTSPLPPPEMVLMTGPIMTRTSLRSLVMKKWNPSQWMRYGGHTLLVFRSRDHMDDWMHNPYHGKKQRDFLVKLQIDFMDMMADGGQGGNNNSGGGGGSKEGILGHRLLPIKKKSYGKNEDEMYQFKLERWTNLGCSVLAAFASREEGEVRILHDTIKDMLRRCPNNGLRNIDHMLK
ncbi:hypothetical protein ACHAW5_001473 [Stephanodiscus triporus]|uniref:Uncharacterized protein n=1 Tax=Stephanodiscus triporus TaxID=2934178 RepID=A0ABD3MQB3_9STRA